MELLSFGEDMVGKSFNPNQREDVAEIKDLYAKVIDILNHARTNAIGNKARELSIAITEAQTAQMWAVRSITRD